MNIKTGVQDMKDSSEKYAEYSGRVVRELFEQCVRETAATDAFLVDHPPVVRWVKDVPSAVCPPQSAGLLELAVAAQHDAQGSEAVVQVMSGWGDVSHLLRAGVPSFGIGAGFPGVAHSSSEKVAVNDLYGRARMLALFVHRFLRTASVSPKADG